MDNERLIRSRGFVMIQRRMLWVNRDLRIAFSHEATRDGDIRWLQQAISERVPPNNFVFHFSRVPEDSQVCREILAEIGLPGLVPLVRVATVADSV